MPLFILCFVCIFRKLRPMKIVIVDKCPKLLIIYSSVIVFTGWSEYKSCTVWLYAFAITPSHQDDARLGPADKILRDEGKGCSMFPVQYHCLTQDLMLVICLGLGGGFSKVLWFSPPLEINYIGKILI